MDDEATDNLLSSTEVIVTSEQGDKLATKDNVEFAGGQAHGTVITVYPDKTRQTITGIGSSFTESSAFVLAHLDEDARREVMTKIYSEDGANFSLARTVVGSTDFAVEGKYSYADVPDDAALEHFSIEVDQDGFRKADYSGIRDERYDLLPMIKEALAIKASQRDDTLNIIASAWTAPAWMKDIEDWYVGGTPDNYGQGTGGVLKDEYVSTYADYLVRYYDAYEAEGVDIWGMTPVNEPHGNSGQWESMHFTAESQRDFIRDHLGPALQASGHDDIRILIYDQNRDGMEHWANVVLGDADAAKYVYGTAVHWYSSTYRVFEESLNAVHEKFPAFDIIHTEGTIDNLGRPAPAGVADPAGYEEEANWFGNDAFWWNETATDWAYTASWAPNPDNHPKYVPVHRYARNVIVSLDNWMSGWIDWNVVLDRHGGPNHVLNHCGAPIMIDTDTGQVYYTPVYYVLAQFSRSIRPGDKVVETSRQLHGLGDDALHASATVNDEGLLSVQLLNTTKRPIEYSLQIGEQFADVTIPANAIQTVRVPVR
ncbi:MAG: glycoside hydrolase family 30 beta sandwich domain-containing protein [Woeseiaceae bacterium]|nr:glycoside hydrolase family 30 beta sandwich domain-containing protein [Woeseiaceae bacterium]